MVFLAALTTQVDLKSNSEEQGYKNISQRLEIIQQTKVVNTKYTIQ